MSGGTIRGLHAYEGWHYQVIEIGGRCDTIADGSLLVAAHPPNDGWRPLPVRLLYVPPGNLVEDV